MLKCTEMLIRVQFLMYSCFDIKAVTLARNVRLKLNKMQLVFQIYICVYIYIEPLIGLCTPPPYCRVTSFSWYGRHRKIVEIWVQNGKPGKSGKRAFLHLKNKKYSRWKGKMMWRLQGVGSRCHLTPTLTLWELLLKKWFHIFSTNQWH